MSATIKTFLLLGVFCTVVGLVYGFVTEFQELAGFPALLAVAAMSFMLVVYLWLVQRSTGGTLPEDREDGEIVEMSGDYGAFSPWSWWPLLLATFIGVILIGVAVGWWLVFFAVPLLLLSIVGWTFEYYRGRFQH